MIIILSGLSNSGKDYLSKQLVNKGFEFVKLHTTRPPRYNETDGVEYNFATQRQFFDAIDKDEFIFYQHYNVLVDGKNDVWFYGLKKDSIQKNKNYVLILDLRTLKEFEANCGDVKYKSFYLNISDNIRYDRAKKRGDFNQDEWDRREMSDKLVRDVCMCDCDFVVYDNELKTILELMKK